MSPTCGAASNSSPIARDVYSGHYQQAVECGFMRREEDGWVLGYSPTASWLTTG
jgi:hypothetical protein